MSVLRFDGVFKCQLLYYCSKLKLWNTALRGIFCENQGGCLAGEGYMVWRPALPGCHTWGESREQLLEMLQDAIQGWIEVFYN
jgi:HicB_like antitoxin of bacterial toxin-antitoxin system